MFWSPSFSKRRAASFRTRKEHHREQAAAAACPRVAPGALPDLTAVRLGGTGGSGAPDLTRVPRALGSPSDLGVAAVGDAVVGLETTPSARTSGVPDLGGLVLHSLKVHLPPEFENTDPSLDLPTPTGEANSFATTPTGNGSSSCTGSSSGR